MDGTVKVVTPRQFKCMQYMQCAVMSEPEEESLQKTVSLGETTVLWGRIFNQTEGIHAGYIL